MTGCSARAVSEVVVYADYTAGSVNWTDLQLTSSRLSARRTALTIGQFERARRSCQQRLYGAFKLSTSRTQSFRCMIPFE